jgi:hypothetical protein
MKGELAIKQHHHGREDRKLSRSAHLMSATPIKGNLRRGKGIMNEEHVG